MYFYYTLINKLQKIDNEKKETTVINYPYIKQAPNVIMDPYGPPLRNDGIYFPRDSNRSNNSSDVRTVPTNIPIGIPINMETRGLSSDYTQLGILTRMSGGDMILPLMGRKLMSGLDKWHYYTISNTGNMNTKLPISLKGRSCSGEYGCDSINNGDVVYVEGYNDTFRITVYENSRFNYIPYI